MLHTVESNIRFKAILIYIIVAAICGGMIFYIYQLRDSVDIYKSNIEIYNDEIIKADSLVQFINSTQQEANQYILTRRLTHLRQFRQNLSDIEQHLDSLALREEAPYQNLLLKEVNELLKEKGSIISKLNRQFNMQHIPDSITEILSTYEPVIQTDSIVISTIKQDTTMHIIPQPKRNFFQKIFSAAQEQDTIYSISSIQTDTLLIINHPQTDSIPQLSEISNYTEQMRQEYTERLTSIQNQVNRLVLADQEISSRISGLLLDLYGNFIRTILNKIEQQEEEIRHTNTLSLLTGGIALALILLFIILIFGDVNRGFRNRKALEKANQQIKQTMESRHQLLLSVSHDIKTPLNAILGQLELAGTPSGLTGEGVAEMKHAGEHILSLLHNLLEFSGLEQGVLESSPTPFNLYELCEETIGICRPLARQKKLDFIFFNSFDKDLHICSDRLKIKQILINLLSNAIKYTPEGKIEFKTESQEGRICFIVSDTGVGMSKEEIEKIFRPFVRVGSHDSAIEGSGIGMYVVKGLTDLLGGTIEVESDKEKGTSIRITLPAPAASVKKNTEKRKLLIIDDNASFLLLLKDMLVHLGHTADTCQSIQEFEQAISSPSGYDMVFTDMEMGTISGIDILQLIQEKQPQIPVVIMTGRGDFTHAKAIELGFDNFLPKPVSLQSLDSLFNGNIVDKENRFEDLEAMFGHDKEIIHEIMETFINSTLLHINNLQEAIEQDDFSGAQRICHTMLPMFMQINAGETTGILKEMDSRRNDPATDHPGWKEETRELILATGKLIEKIQETYPGISSPI